MRCVCFDLDGTLVDTLELNRQAYAALGIKMPREAWGQRWQAWLPQAVNKDWHEASVIHSLKGHLYADLIETCDIEQITLPAARVARELLEQGLTVWCLTASARYTASLLLERLDLPILKEANLAYEARRNALVSFQREHGVVGYVDDSEENISRLTRDIPPLRLIHYQQQTYEELMDALYGSA